MRGKLFASLFAGALLLWAAGPDSNSLRLINSLDGAKLYKAYCAACHGMGGEGNGPAAWTIKVSPPALTQIAERNGGAFPMARVERIISGEEVSGSHGTREMPLWGAIFSQVGPDQDLGRVRVDNLTRYLMSIQTHTAASVP